MQKRTVAASIQKAVGKAFVYASHDKAFLEAADVIGNLKKSVTHASFECNDCGTSMVVDASLKPLCITCGSHKVNLTEAKTQVGALTDADLTAVNCNACKMVNVVQTKTVEASSHSLHCTACGTPLVLATADDAEGPAKLGEDNVEPDTLKVPDHPETPKASMTNVDNVPTPEGAEPAQLPGTETPSMSVPDQPEVADADEMPDNDYDDEAVELELSGLDEDADEGDETAGELPDFIKDKKAKDDDGEKEESDFITSEDFSDEGVLPDAVTLDEDTAEADADLDFEAEDAGEPLVDSMELDDSEMALSFVQVAGRLVAMKGPVAIATLTTVRAGANADLMNDAAFHEAVKISAKNKGMRKALQAFGFKSLRVNVLSPARVNAEKAKVLEESKADRKAFMARLEKSLALAAAGLARDRFRTHKNVLSDALVAELKTVGVRNSKAMVARIMATHGVEFAKELITVAETLAKMPEDARNAMADVLGMTREEAAEDMLTDDVSDDDDGILEDDFDSITSRVNANRIITNTAVASTKVSASVQEILAGRANITFLGA